MSTRIKSGIPLKKRKRRTILTHEEKKWVARMLINRIPRKVVADKFNISLPSLYKIQSEYVVVTLSERYPDQLELFG